MISIAVHIIFVWVLNLTMHAQTVKEVPAQKPEIKEEMKKEKEAVSPVMPTQPNIRTPAPRPAL